MKKKLERIKSVCQHNSMLHKLSQRAQYLEQLNHKLQQALPAQFSAHCRLANIKDNTLIIYTDNPSLASLVRFQSPVLCKALSAELDQTFTSLEVKVRPHHIPLQTSHSRTISLPKSAAISLKQTAQDMDDGPLKTALEKLAKRQS